MAGETKHAVELIGMTAAIQITTLLTEEPGPDEKSAYTKMRDDIVDGYTRLFHLHFRQRDFADAQYCLQQIIAYSPQYRHAPDMVAAQIAVSMLLGDQTTEQHLRQMAEHDGLLNDTAVKEFLTRTKQYITLHTGQ